MPRIRLSPEEREELDAQLDQSNDEVEDEDRAIDDEVDEEVRQFKSAKAESARNKRAISKDMKFQPTEEQRDLVTHCKVLNYSIEKICALIINPWTGKPIHHQTLNEAFAEELALGKEKVQLKINRSVFMQAIGIDPVIDVDPQTGKRNLVHPGRAPVPIMSMYFEKTRFGVKEGQPIQGTGPDQSPDGDDTLPGVMIMLPSNGRDGPRQVEARPDIIENPAQRPEARGAPRKSMLGQMAEAERSRPLIDLPTKG